ncbi:MAG TPA: hypothetical protein VKU94_00965 [Geobacterales bacterium]|nr:hypothetical protein [Geobacterales bacterium]
MNISLTLIKILSVVSILIISSFMILSFLNAHQYDYSSRVASIDPETASKMLKETLNDIYFTNEQNYIKILNLGGLSINIQKTAFNFSIGLPNETLSWILNLYMLCLSNICEYSQNDLYSINSQPIREINTTIIATLNIEVNKTGLENITIYNFYVSILNFNFTGKITGENSIRIESQKNAVTLTRIFQLGFMLSFYINGSTIYSLKINDRSIINFYLIGIKVNLIQQAV